MAEVLSAFSDPQRYETNALNLLEEVSQWTLASYSKKLISSVYLYSIC